MTKEYLKSLDVAYYEGSPLVSDEEYDKMKDEYNRANPQSTYSIDEVGEEDMAQSTFEKVSHGVYIMGSLDKLRNIEELMNWTKPEYYPMRVDEKEDGLSIKIVYDNGKFVQAITRGNGNYGFDVTENVRLFDFPKTIQNKELVILRGEVVFTFDNFNKARELMSGDVSKSPRNLASGLIKRKDELEALKYLTIRFYDIMNYSDIQGTVSIQDTLISLLGKKYVTHSIVLDSLQELMKLYSKYNSSLRSELDREIDGLVLKTRTGDSIALKFPPTIKQTRIRNVNWQTGVSGRITPVAEIEPIQLNGVTVSNVTLHNIGYVRNYKIGMSVGVCRSGDVIPKIVDIYSNEGVEIQLPTTCPVCGCKTEVEEKYLMCNNPDCITKLSGRIVKWFVIHDVKGIGMATLETLIEKKIITSFVDFLNLAEGKSDDILLALDGIGSSTVKLLKENINATLTTSLVNFLSGLNITNIDNKIFEKILESMNMNEVDLNSILSYIYSDKLECIKGIGDITVNKIRAGITAHKEEIEKMTAVIKIIPFTFNTSSIFSGKSFVITGTLSKPRKHFENLIKELGGKFSNSITKDLDYLLCGADAGSKLDKAKSYNVKVISEDEFNSLIK